MKNLIKILLIIVTVSVFLACDKQKEIDGNLAQSVESINMGTVTTWCDADIYEILDTAFVMYDDFYEKVNIDVSVVTSRNAMSQLLSANARVVIIARDYLPDEDSLMKEYEVEPYYRMEVAKDAVVFFVNNGFPLDTLSDEIAKAVLGSNESLNKYFDNLNSEPIFATVDQNSSVYANIKRVILNGNEIKKPIKLFSTIDSVRQFVRETPNSIGIGYLGHIARSDEFKMLKMGFTHPEGKREYPQVVHQSYVVMERYPYIISYWAYLLEERRNLPFWFASFLSKEARVQSWFKDAGIVPAYANFRLIQSE